MDRLPFFTDENKDLLYNLCRDEIYKELQYNIDENRKYYKTFGEIMKIVHKHSKNENNLIKLNKEVLSKTIPYIKKEVQKKKLKQEPMLPPNTLQQHTQVTNSFMGNPSPPQGKLPVSFRAQDTHMAHQNLAPVDQNYEQMLNSRDAMFQKPVVPEVNFNKNIDENLPDPTKLMEANLKARQEMNQQFNIPQSSLQNQFQPNTNQGIDNNQVTSLPKPLLENRKMLSQDSSVPLNNISMEVENFSLSNSVMEGLQVNNVEGSHINKDMNTYSEKNNDVDPMELLNRYQEENKKQDESYLKVQESRDNFAERNQEANLNLELGAQQKQLDKDLADQQFKDSLTFTMEQRMNNMQIDDIKSQLDGKLKPFEEDSMANDILAPQNNIVYEENKIFQELKEKQFKERKYVNKENLVIINSADRDWFNDSSENRYNFQVRFNPEPDGPERVPVFENGVIKKINGEIVYETVQFKGEQGAGIQQIFKNIVSFELVRVLMPVENFIIPFDNRMFVDYKSLPYIVLKIDEIEGLYGGSNSNTNKAFAQLLWDKDHTSEVLPEAQLTDSSKTFARQLKRGFSSMAPMSFEKKTFYPTPLSSLNRLTIALETPYGESIKNHSDSLEINTVKFADLKHLTSALEVTASAGFTGINNQNAIQITTKTQFNNRVFKVGDTIQIKNFVLDSSQNETNVNLNDFFNREQGHFIINLDKEDSNGTDNKGFITTLYISPPGTIDYTASSGLVSGTQSSLLSSLTYSAGVTPDIRDSDTTCKIINKSLQTHFVFKVVTREEDIHSHIISSNV